MYLMNSWGNIESREGEALHTTKCIIHGADKDGYFSIFAQRHGLYINVVRHYFWTEYPTYEKYDYFTINLDHL
jgi:hypothetical protein